MDSQGLPSLDDRERDVVGGICSHPSPDPEFHRDANTSEPPSPAATQQRQTMAPVTPAYLRAQRRADTLKALRTATVIDLTADDTPPSPAATRPQTMAPVTPEGLRTRGEDALETLGTAPGIDLTNDDSPPARPGRERLAVYPTSLKLSGPSNITRWTFKDGRWTDRAGRTLSTRIDHVRHIVRVVVRPSSGYPTSFRLKRHKPGDLTGKYGEDKTGRISLGARAMRAIIQLDCSFGTTIWKSI